MLFGQKSNNDTTPVSSVQKGDIIFLHFVTSEQEKENQFVEGPFVAVTNGEKNIDIKAWEGQYPWQVRVSGENGIIRIYQSSFDKFNLKYQIPDRFFSFKIEKTIGDKWKNYLFRVFKGNFKEDIFECYYIDDYYAKFTYTDEEITPYQRVFRETIWKFKDGENRFVFTLSSCLNNKFGSEFLKNQTLAFIPASTKEKTKTRFQNFAEKVCRETGMSNGFGLIQSKLDREPKHISGVSNSLPFNERINLNPNLKDKSIILVDDIYNTGRSFREMASELKSVGAKSVIGVFLGKNVKKIKLIC